MAIQIDGRSLAPNLLGAFTSGRQSTQALKNQRLLGQRQQQLIDQTKAQALGKTQAAAQAVQTGQLAGQIVGGQLPEGVTRQQAIGQIFAKNPQLAEKTLSTLGIQDQASADEFSNFAFDLQNTPFAQRAGKIQQRALDLQSQNRDPSHTLDLANLDEDQQNQVAETIQLAALTTKERFATRGKKAVKQKVEGGLVFDPNTGSFAVDPVAKQHFAEIAAKANTQGGLDFKDKQSLNKDVTALLKNTVMINNTAKDLEKLGTISSGPASIALVFKFMKALDPTSVVREGEFATAENSAGVPESVGNIYNKLVNGERLGSVQISQFIETAKQLSNTSASASKIEVGSMLDAFGDTIPEKFKTGLLGRIPGQFEVTTTTDKGSDKSIFSLTPLAVETGQEAQAQRVQQAQAGTIDLSGLSDADLMEF